MKAEPPHFTAVEVCLGQINNNHTSSHIDSYIIKFGILKKRICFVFILVIYISSRFKLDTSLLFKIWDISTFIQSFCKGFKAYSALGNPMLNRVFTDRNEFTTEFLPGYISRHSRNRSVPAYASLNLISDLRHPKEQIGKFEIHKPYCFELQSFRIFHWLQRDLWGVSNIRELRLLAVFNLDKRTSRYFSSFPRQDITDFP